jgi:uncharacterized protein YbjT (DUF2867 family)
VKVLIFGATGMVGQGVLRECLLAPDVEQVTTVGRTPVEQSHLKLQHLVHADLFALASRDLDLQGFEACFFCLGVSSSGMDEASYRHMTYGLTLTVATQLARLNPAMTFVYVSGAGTDSSEQGRSMWARVKGQTENDLKRLPFRSVYLFRPSVIQPLAGIESKTPAYQRFYSLANPLLTLIRRIFPSAIVTTEDIGKAMLAAARQGDGRVVVETQDIIRLARGSGP